MWIKQLEIEGYRSYGDKIVIDLSKSGIVLLTGENRDRGISSAAGKSSIFKALCCALFEQNDDGSVKDQAINTLRADKGCRIAVTFEINDITYYVVYARKHPVEGTDWRVWWWTGTDWEDMREQRLSDTKSVIQKIIGVTYAQFINIAYLEQKKVADFIERTDKERREIFSTTLQLDQCDVYVKRAKEWRQRMEKKRLSLQAKIEILNEQVKEEKSALAKININSLTGSLEEIERSIVHLEGEIEEAKKNAHSLDDLVALNEEFKLNKDRATHLFETARQIRDSCPDLCLDFPAVESLLDHHEKSVADLSQNVAEAQAELTIATNHAKHICTIGSECKECKQPVSPQYRQKQQQKYEREADGWRRRHEEILKLLKITQTAKADVQRRLKSGQEYNALILQAQECEQRAGEIEKHFADVGELAGNDIVAHAKEIRERYESYTAEKEHWLKKKPEIEIQISRYWDLQESLGKHSLSLDSANSSFAETDELIANISICESLLGDKGFKAFKIEESRVQFNTYLAEYLSVLTDGEVEAELVTKKLKADGKTYKDEIDILIRDGMKESIPIDQYSGGEQTTLSLAITGAFSKLAYEQHGKGVNVLLLDEPFGMMDGWGEEKACLLLNTFRDSGRIILVVTNHDHVRNHHVFDREIRAVKENHISQIEEFDLSGEH